MLTRLEVHGFKNLLNFSVDFGPFNCIAGPNGVGKSNIFDAIRFLSLLTDHTLVEAALKIRGADAEIANLEDVFWTDGKHRMIFAWMFEQVYFHGGDSVKEPLQLFHY